jgi:DNA-binding MltR family transcriptional regulator
MTWNETEGRKMAALDLPHLEEFLAFLPKLAKESERGMVLIGTSFIDELLKRTLLAFLVEDSQCVKLVDGFNAPLGSLSTRTAAAYALGLISEKENAEADTLRRIRNRFAHDIHVSFADQIIIDLCKNLTMAAEDYGDVGVVPQGRFTTSATALILNLTNRPHHVAIERRYEKSWPN